MEAARARVEAVVARAAGLVGGRRGRDVPVRSADRGREGRSGERRRTRRVRYGPQLGSAGSPDSQLTHRGLEFGQIFGLVELDIWTDNNLLEIGEPAVREEAPPVWMLDLRLAR